MSERKVLTKYYPPDFDPSKLERRRGPKQTGPKRQDVRLMAPFSMKCTSCGEYIYKGRKFNAQKETTDMKYMNEVPIFRFYIKCTRCSAQITFRTDPKHNDYECEKGARRNFEVWRAAKLAEETEEEMLDRLEKEEAERDAMKEFEQKKNLIEIEMAEADMLSQVRRTNAMREKIGKEGVMDMVSAPNAKDEEEERLERELEEQARKAFESGTGDKIRRLEVESPEETAKEMADKASMPPPAAPTFQRQKKKKKDFSAALGIKKVSTPG